jgi:hypothetical protein
MGQGAARLPPRIFILDLLDGSVDNCCPFGVQTETAPEILVSGNPGAAAILAGFGMP